MPQDSSKFAFIAFAQYCRCWDFNCKDFNRCIDWLQLAAQSLFRISGHPEVFTAIIIMIITFASHRRAIFLFLDVLYKKQKRKNAKNCQKHTMRSWHHLENENKRGHVTSLRWPYS